MWGGQSEAWARGTWGQGSRSRKRTDWPTGWFELVFTLPLPSISSHLYVRVTEGMGAVNACVHVAYLCVHLRFYTMMESMTVAVFHVHPLLFIGFLHVMLCCRWSSHGLLFIHWLACVILIRSSCVRRRCQYTSTPKFSKPSVHVLTWALFLKLFNN